MAVMTTYEPETLETHWQRKITTATAPSRCCFPSVSSSLLPFFLVISIRLAAFKIDSLEAVAVTVTAPCFKDPAQYNLNIPFLPSYHWFIS